MALQCKIDYSNQWACDYYQMNFWCGFCRQVIPADHEQTTQSAVKKKTDNHKRVNRRYDHIETHFHDGKKMEDWVFWEANKSAADLAHEGSLRDAYFVSGVLGSSDRTQGARTRPKAIPLLEKQSTDVAVGQKRKATDQLAGGGKKQIVSQTWTCHQCFNGPMLTKVYGSCVNCEHTQCEFCTQEGNKAKITQEGNKAKILTVGPHDSWKDTDIETDRLENMENMERLTRMYPKIGGELPRNRELESRHGPSWPRKG